MGVIIAAMMMMVMIASLLTVTNAHTQPNKGRGELKELRMLCAEDEQGRTCWMTAFRLFKVTARRVRSESEKRASVTPLSEGDGNRRDRRRTSNYLSTATERLLFSSLDSTASYCTRITRSLNKGKPCCHTSQRLW